MLFPQLVCFLFIFEFGQELLVHPHRPPSTFARFPAFQGGLFFDLEVILEHQPALLARVISHETLSSRLKAALLKSWVVIQLFALFLHLGILNSTMSWSLQPRLPLTFTSLTSSSFFVRIGSSRACALCGSLITCVRRWSLMHFQKLHGLLVSCCVVPPVDTGVAKVPNED